jgi:putative Holliday junction resolvase
MGSGRILAVDFGQRRIGVAISDPLGLTAQSLPTLHVRNLKEAVQAVERLASQHDVAEIVVGLPLHLSGADSRQSERTRRFARLLHQACQRPVKLWDERYSSAEAMRTMRDLGESPSRHRDKLNQLAAVFILQGYLDRLHSQRET